MKYCSKCGAKIYDEAVVCVKCGCQVDTLEESESSIIGILAIVFSFYGGLLGLIFSIIGLVRYELPENKRNCSIGLIIFFIWMFVVLILIVILCF